MSRGVVNRARTTAVAGVATLVLMLAVHASAQSGRHAPKSQNQTGNTNKPEPDSPAARPLGGSLSSPVKLLIARQPTSKHLPSEDAIAASFVKRLNDFVDITATFVGDLKRDDVVKRAKAETEKWVVHLQFAIDSFQGGTIVLNSQSLEVKYTVFAAQTGKQLIKGKVYFQPIGSGRMRKSDWPNGTPIKITSEGTGIEAADQLYYSLRVIVGVKH